MSNNKLRIISLLFPIPFFIFATLSLFIIDYNVISKNYNDSVNGVNYNMVYNSKNIDSEIQNRLDRTLSDSKILESGIPTIWESINAVYALIDSEGNVIAKSAPCILISCYDDDTEEKTGYSGKIIDLEPYFTDEISS
ncbi:MAG: hypothetical protein MJ120_01800, partial [Clostridia bacterium]|nr:hypothetical protein [Clostridia bacterium]